MADCQPMTALLSLVTVLAWGSWIPVAQAVRGVPQPTRTFYATIGAVVFAAVALGAGGGHVSLGWRGFWLPFAGGVVWTGGNFAAFRASEAIGLARASGFWTPLNILVGFVWGASLFGELRGFGAHGLGLLVGGLVLVLLGVALIISSQEPSGPGADGPGALVATGRPPREGLAAPLGQASSQPVPLACSGAATSCLRSGLVWRLRWPTSSLPSACWSPGQPCC